MWMRSLTARAFVLVASICVSLLAERAHAANADCPTSAYAINATWGWQLQCGSAGCDPGYTCQGLVFVLPTNPNTPGVVTVETKCVCARWDEERLSSNRSG